MHFLARLGRCNVEKSIWPEQRAPLTAEAYNYRPEQRKPAVISGSRLHGRCSSPSPQPPSHFPSRVLFTVNKIKIPPPSSFYHYSTTPDSLALGVLPLFSCPLRAISRASTKYYLIDLISATPSLFGPASIESVSPPTSCAVGCNCTPLKRRGKENQTTTGGGPVPS